ncbi:MAG TPA: 1-(5-phosphoribosyl)-5-[(5-phosphoribosylamino)methylideneamino]imidazole-4-carboxamide isomerase [Thermomicrobiaceae bacterium]|nr:1-(5-phosphoribosyl)-5-[(5-phosphoribosylamino)methylideneamino]imidazole-4-carboxamide isomerase [Thermomicrobiaceae bacterium]
MLIIPALDLRAGRCVRLTQGDFDRETRYDDDPLAVARRWQRLGARWLHVVDLDGARMGVPAQLPLVRAIAALGVPVELGGGLRTLDDLRAAIDAGAGRVVIGTAAVEDPALLREAVTIFGAERVVLGLDARAGQVALRGWREQSTVPVEAVVSGAREAGVRRVIFTDIARDGTLSAPNYAAIAAVARLGLPVIASGGVATREQLARLAAIRGVEAAIVGKALYAGAITIEDESEWNVVAEGDDERSQ